MSSFKPSVDGIASSHEPSVDATARVFILQNMILRATFKLVPATNYEITLPVLIFFNGGSWKRYYRAQFLDALHLVTPIPGKKVTSGFFSAIFHSGDLKIKKKRTPITQQFITHPVAPGKTQFCPQRC